MSPSLGRRLSVEFVGTAFLLAAIVGSGIMGQRLAGGNLALVLLANTLAASATLFVTVTAFRPVSGAHFNPCVTAIAALADELSWRHALAYVGAQCAGAMAGVWCAHLMFDVPVLELSGTVRFGPGQWLAEGVATFGLVLTIISVRQASDQIVGLLVGLYIAAAYWFTASTSFANPAVTLARAFTSTFSGIRPLDVPLFVAAELAGAFAAWLFCAWLTRPLGQQPEVSYDRHDLPQP